MDTGALLFLLCWCMTLAYQQLIRQPSTMLLLPGATTYTSFNTYSPHPHGYMGLGFRNPVGVQPHQHSIEFQPHEHVHLQSVGVQPLSATPYFGSAGQPTFYSQNTNSGWKKDHLNQAALQPQLYTSSVSPGFYQSGWQKDHLVGVETTLPVSSGLGWKAGASGIPTRGGGGWRQG